MPHFEDIGVRVTSDRHRVVIRHLIDLPFWEQWVAVTRAARRDPMYGKYSHWPTDTKVSLHTEFQQRNSVSEVQ